LASMPAPAASSAASASVEPVPSTRPEPGRSSPTVLIAVLVVVLIATAAIVFGVYHRTDAGSRPQDSSTVSTTGDQSDPPATPPAPSPTATPTPTPSSDGYPSLKLSGRFCGRSGDGPHASAAAGNGITTCPFAVNVGREYEREGVVDGPVTLRVYSPKLDRTYSMSCAGDQPVVCTGGTNALVYLYGGSAEFSG
jgi:hypothetical protein